LQEITSSTVGDCANAILSSDNINEAFCKIIGNDYQKALSIKTGQIVTCVFSNSLHSAGEIRKVIGIVKKNVDTLVSTYNKHSLSTVNSPGKKLLILDRRINRHVEKDLNMYYNNRPCCFSNVFEWRPSTKEEKLFHKSEFENYNKKYWL
jgi:hypothetical protein